MKRGYISLGHGQVHYREAGTRGMPVILWLHQSPSSSEMYEALIVEMGEGYHHLAPDTPGFGQSDGLPDFTIPRFGDVMAEFLKLKGVTKAHIFGHHTGASVAAALTARYPQLVSKLVLSGPPMLNEEFHKKLPSTAANESLTADGSHLLKLWAKIRSKEPNMPLDISQRELALGFQAMAINKAAYQAVTDHDFASDIRKIEQPTLLLAGDQDPLFSCLDAAYAALQNGSKAIIPGAASYVCEREVPSVVTMLSEFFGEG